MTSEVAILFEVCDSFTILERIATMFRSSTNASVSLSIFADMSLIAIFKCLSGTSSIADTDLEFAADGGPGGCIAAANGSDPLVDGCGYGGGGGCQAGALAKVFDAAGGCQAGPLAEAPEVDPPYDTAGAWQTGPLVEASAADLTCKFSIVAVGLQCGAGGSLGCCIAAANGSDPLVGDGGNIGGGGCQAGALAKVLDAAGGCQAGPLAAAHEADSTYDTAGSCQIGTLVEATVAASTTDDEYSS